MLRGTSAGLEIVFGRRPFAETADDVVARLAERPEFYRGSRAYVFLGDTLPDERDFSAFIDRLRPYELAIDGVYGETDARALASSAGARYLGTPPRARVARIEPKRARPARNVADLSPEARSLDADFAGARADLAGRRGKRGSHPVAAVVPAAPATLLHRGTLRGGGSLVNGGNIVVVGDVNPGAELIASGDIVVVGALRGTAHAGAQGDLDARVTALDLVPTQLRIGNLIAVDAGGAGREKRGPEEAFVSEGRIAIAALGERR